MGGVESSLLKLVALERRGVLGSDDVGDDDGGNESVREMISSSTSWSRRMQFSEETSEKIFILA